jgi:hypothetical protein
MLEALTSIWEYLILVERLYRSTISLLNNPKSNFNPYEGTLFGVGD